MISEGLLSIVRCPDCHGSLVPDGVVNSTDVHGGFTGDEHPRGRPRILCTGCGRVYDSGSADYLDLRPATAFTEQTKYLDESLHADARHERVSPPLLGSKIRNDMLRAFLAPAPGDLVIDLGCGSGRTLLWNRDWGAHVVGIDIAPFFSTEARRGVDLLIGDLRKLPFADGTFTRAFSLDVLEHLSPDAVRGMLAEARRVLAPGGTLFVYTHVRRNARIAIGLKWINALARQLDRAGLIDLRQEHLRKSDHLNPLADIPELEQVAHEAGFRIARMRYYTPIVGGFVENILMRVAERAMAKRAAKRIASTTPADQANAQAIKAARTAAKDRIARSPSTRLVLQVLSVAMKLDLVLFGRIRSGPFFALLTRV
ncbi:MAG: class I SAM-dependent methyltransferase [Acidobacteria bacterium]|nr:class I SAM-dependent methyltransferase [Acidobacteriota bacterium]